MWLVQASQGHHLALHQPRRTHISRFSCAMSFMVWLVGVSWDACNTANVGAFIMMLE